MSFDLRSPFRRRVAPTTAADSGKDAIAAREAADVLARAPTPVEPSRSQERP